MSVLSNLKLVESLQAGNLIIKPVPPFSPDMDSNPYDTCSVELHIDSVIFVPKKDLKVHLDLSRPGDFSDTVESVFRKSKIPTTGYNLEPGEFILAQTKEKVGFPIKHGQQQLAGRIEGRSSFARTGLFVHFTAPTLHANWTGNVTLELLNHGPHSLTLHPNLPICQLIVETVEGHVIPKQNSKFNNQNTPSGSNGNKISLVS
jgi:dCTP deaminase